jgi:uncharacterized protein
LTGPRCGHSASDITSRHSRCSGSALREDFRADSDIDVLVEFEPEHVPGLAFVAIERELSDLLQGRRVDLVTPKFLNPRIRQQVLRDAESLYVAA